MNLRFNHLTLCALLLATAGTTGLISVTSAVSSSAAPSAAAPKPVKGAVKDITGKRYNLADARAKATVLMFISHDCPISNAYAPEISRIAADYAQRKVRFLVVYAEPDFSATHAREHARQYGYKVPIVLDGNYQLSHQVGAMVTPQAVVLGPSGKRLYAGRIDNLYIGFGRKRTQPTQRDLRQALDAVTGGKSVPHPTTTAIGCFIPAESE